LGCCFGLGANSKWLKILKNGLYEKHELLFFFFPPRTPPPPYWLRSDPTAGKDDHDDQ
jgi:hypothetical protein